LFIYTAILSYYNKNTRNKPVYCEINII